MVQEIRTFAPFLAPEPFALPPEPCTRHMHAGTRASQMDRGNPERPAAEHCAQTAEIARTENRAKTLLCDFRKRRLPKLHELQHRPWVKSAGLSATQ